MKLSPQERQRRSDLARRLHAEGRLGGGAPARKSAEVRARRASELSAQIVEKHRAKIERAIVAGLDSPSTSQRLKAAELALKMGLSAERAGVAEQASAHQAKSRDELIALLADKLANSQAGQLVRERVGELPEPVAVDAVVVE